MPSTLIASANPKLAALLVAYRNAAPKIQAELTPQLHQSLNELLVAFLQGDEDAREVLPQLVQASLLRRVAGRANDLVAAGLDEDVVQRFWELLLQKQPSSFNPRYPGSAWRFLHYLLLTALGDVYDSMAPRGIGERSHKKKPATRGSVEQPQLISERERRVETCSLDAMMAEQDAEGGNSLFETIVDDTVDVERVVGAKLELEELVAYVHTRVPPSVLTAWYAIYRDGLNFTEAAQMSDMSRYALRRHCNSVVAALPSRYA